MDAPDVIDAPVNAEPESRTLIAPFTLTRDADVGDGLTLTGYAAVFNSPTRIANYEGDFTEVVAPGAFKRSINAHKPVIQFDHGTHPVIGSVPIASIKELREDERGLYIEARLFDNWMTEPLRDAINGEAITGMSFRFSVVKDTWTRAGGEHVRTLKEVKLYELGPVVHPAYLDTSVALRSLERAAGIHILGTSDAPASGTADEPAASDDPAPRHSTRTRNQRLALVQALNL
jgi:HK97 family phage prohead protease